MVDNRNPGSIEFDAEILRNTEVANSSAWVEFPFSVWDLFGVKGRVPVAATVDDEPYRGSLMKMGGAAHMLVMVKALREKMGKQPGDTVHVRLELDTSPRTVELAGDVQDALERTNHAAKFRALSYSHQREYQQWIDEAKRSDTRSARIAKMTEMLDSGGRLKS